MTDGVELAAASRALISTLEVGVCGAAKPDASQVGNLTHNGIASHELRLGLRMSLVEGVGGGVEC